jgi:hypothetical protein
MFRSYDHHQVENILLARISQLTTDPYHILMDIIGYVTVCVKLYCYVGFPPLVSFTTCFGLLGHLQVCTFLIFKESA